MDLVPREGSDVPVIGTRDFKKREESGAYVLATGDVYEDFGGGHSKKRYTAGERVPMADARKFGLVPVEPEAKKEPKASVEDKKAPAPANKKRSTKETK